MDDIHDIKPIIDVAYFSWKMIAFLLLVLALVVIIFWERFSGWWDWWKRRHDIAPVVPKKKRIDPLKEAHKKLKEAKDLLADDRTEESLLRASYAWKLHLDGTYTIPATGMTACDIISDERIPQEKRESFSVLLQTLNEDNFSPDEVTKEDATAVLAEIEEHFADRKK